MSRVKRKHNKFGHQRAASCAGQSLRVSLAHGDAMLAQALHYKVCRCQRRYTAAALRSDIINMVIAALANIAHHVLVRTIKQPQSIYQLRCFSWSSHQCLVSTQLAHGFYFMLRWRFANAVIANLCCCRITSKSTGLSTACFARCFERYTA